MKTIVCFGDSNTWGYVPGSEALRFPPDVRWPGVMRAELGDDYRIVEEALNGRTSAWDDPLKPNRRGADHLPMVLESQAPIDLVIISLGCNDLKHHLHLTAHDIAQGVGFLAEMVQASDAGPVIHGRKTAPKVLMVCPSLPVDAQYPFGHKFDTAIERSKAMPEAYREIAEQIGCLYGDANTVTDTCPIDGVHLDESGHGKLGKALAMVVSTHFQ